MAQQEVAPITEEEFQAIFQLFDRDNDNSIDVKELGNMMRAFGMNPTDDEVRIICVKVDEDGSGKISQSELRNLIQEAKQRYANDTEAIAKAFGRFDKNGDGLILPDELRSILHKIDKTIGDEEISDMIEAVDVNMDGKIDIQEFSAFMNKPLRP